MSRRRRTFFCSSKENSKAGEKRTPRREPEGNAEPRLTTSLCLPSGQCPPQLRLTNRPLGASPA
ncbi:hypothetical protein STEG23_030538, partial [Scotinomys teguina]